MEHLKKEVYETLHEFDKRAEVQKVNENDLQKIFYLTEIYCNLCKIEKEAEHTEMSGNPQPHQRKVEY